MWLKRPFSGTGAELADYSGVERFHSAKYMMLAKAVDPRSYCGSATSLSVYTGAPGLLMICCSQQVIRIFGR
jgi:hypothetical protein